MSVQYYCGKYYNVDIFTGFRYELPLVDDDQFIYQIDYSNNTKLLVAYTPFDDCYLFYHYDVKPNKYTKIISYKLLSKDLNEYIKYSDFKHALQTILGNIYNMTHINFDNKKFNNMIKTLEDFHIKLEKLKQF